MSFGAQSLAAELRIFVDMRKDHCCLAGVLRDRDPDAGRILDVRSDASAKAHVLCAAMAGQLLGHLPDTRAEAMRLAMEGEHHADP